MDTFNSVLLGILGLGIAASLTFEVFANYSNILGPLGMILILGPHISNN